MNGTGSGGAAAGGEGAGTKVFLLAAVGLGILATVLAFVLIQSASGVERGPKTYIVVAAHDLSPNAPIDPDRDLKRDAIPPQYAAMAQRGLDWDTRASYKGQRVNRDVLAGQPVLLADIAAVGQLVLEKPYYALTLPAETGMIIPGDFVKIILPRGAGAAGIAAEPAIIGRDDGYKVLAVGGYLFKTRQQVLSADQYASTSASSAKTVTLQVTEPQAKEIMAALGSVTGNSQKAILLLCPSPTTVAPETRPQ